MKKVYLKDIAEQLNVSKTAVSLVLNNKGDENKISQETQKRIIKFAKDHNYVPNHLARGLSRGKTETIGLIIPNISDTFYAKIAGSIEARAAQEGFTVVFSSSNESPKKESSLIGDMLNRQVDGLIVASTQKNQKDIKMLMKNNFPLVLIDRNYPDLDTNFVVVDNYGGMNKATKHLLSKGKKRIVFVAINSDLEALKQRYLGYRDAVEKFEGNPNEPIEIYVDYNNYEADVKKKIKEFVEPKLNVDAFVFSTHYLAREGLRALKGLNVKVPEEVAMVSFSDLSAAFDLVEPPITSVLQPVEEMGNMAVDILLDEMGATKVKTMNDKKRILEVEFIVRKSCGS
ncbi:LacI family DNA-binding transcriptional regulator [Jejuia spongiicola]|uniref:LacI family transcriptional regulator n=1 Tax=Jejuia spongiicola TaxID=2942207 RepID=A0ABT0QHW8_9FLAO|nr:LacI family DNA-binding transcriptional regulator [Jejuia spongiicola]MCL6296586.1 LacI family transcriptional regulator [Jejuia spongiicola]